MKKLILFLFVVLFFAEGRSQYNKLLGNTRTEWDVFLGFLGVEQGQKMASPLATPVVHGRYTALNDTIVLSKSYKKFYYAPTTSTVGTHYGYLREDTISKKVYYLDKVSLVEDLLYDFSLSVGDSVFLNFPSAFGVFPIGYYKVKSIQNVTIKAGIRKQFNLKKNIGISDTLKIIEGVGSIIHPIYLYKNNYFNGMFNFGGPCKYPYELGVACKFSDYNKQYQSCTYSIALGFGCVFKLDSCNYWSNCGGINELNIVKNLSVAPNPAVTKCDIMLELDQNSATTIELYDISGRKIKTISSEKLKAGKNEITFDVSDLLNGLYFIKTKSEDFELSYPLIIQH